MKELSIEEKARAYDIALDKIKMLLGTGSSCSREELEYIFPELAESEDERIRKALISVLKSDFEKDTTIHDISVGDIIAWLEKQAEQKPAYSEEMIEAIKNKEYAKGFDDGYNNAKQPKQEWSEDDEEIRKSIIDRIERRRMSSIGSESAICENQINWLKSLSSQSHWKPSDEQIKGIECAIKTLRHQLNVGDKRLNSLYDDLKKLREE